MENKPIYASFAAIDIGTNAVRLLIKHIDETKGTPIFTKEMLLRVPMRLGFDVFYDGMISEKKAKKILLLHAAEHAVACAHPYATASIYEYIEQKVGMEE